MYSVHTYKCIYAPSEKPWKWKLKHMQRMGELREVDQTATGESFASEAEALQSGEAAEAAHDALFRKEGLDDESLEQKAKQRAREKAWRDWAWWGWPISFVCLAGFLWRFVPRMTPWQVDALIVSACALGLLVALLLLGPRSLRRVFHAFSQHWELKTIEWLTRKVEK